MDQSMRKVNQLFFFFLVLCFVGCVPESKKVLTEVNLGYATKDFQTISDYGHRAQTDSLLLLLADKDPTNRFLAARSFGSHKDVAALDSLYGLMDDPSVKVRGMAAFAIGQIANKESEQALVSGFRQKDTMSVDNHANGEILRALGKIGAEPLARYIASAEGYRETDTLLIEGQMKSLYHFALRGIHNPELTQKVVEVVRNRKLSYIARLYAAHYLGRTRDLDIDKVKFQIAEALVDEQEVDIKMALATALRHTDDPEIYATLINQLSLQQDYRITCNLIRTLSSYDHEKNIPIILELLRSENIHIARTAVEYIFKSGTAKEAAKYRDIAKDSIPTIVKTELYQAVFNILPYYYAKTKNATRWQVQQSLSQEQETYGKIGYLKALGQDPESYSYIMNYADTTDNLIIKTAAIEALGTILAHKDFNFVYQSVSRSNRRKILAYLQEAILTNDEGMVGAAANVIADPAANLKELIDSTTFLLDAKAQLKLPGQVESVHAVERALAHLRGVTKPDLTQLANFKETNWSLLKDFTKTTKAIVKTTKGIFTVIFYLEDAPSTVLNFIELANDNYYDGKVFHRVVPNFVIQTGSPRGDNYGGADYAIRSEFTPLSYTGEGYLGMASAGPHTESTQWFVTHSPALHLDGKYTIFGKVVAGMDVVHNIQVGDEIIDIIISNL